MPAGIPFGVKPRANAATDQTGPGPSSQTMAPILVADSLRNPDSAASPVQCPNLGAQWERRGAGKLGQTTRAAPG